MLTYLGPKDYKSDVTDNVESPDVQKVFYSKAKDAINLVFEQGQTMKWGADTVIAGVTARLQDQFFLDGDESKPAPVASWQVLGNRVTLRFATTISASKLNYIRSFRSPRLDGPVLRNARGLGAFSFHELPIAAALTDPALAATISNSNVMQLSWAKVSDASSYVLERKETGATEFSAIKTFTNNSITTFNDTGVGFDRTYIYRLSAIGPKSESQSETTVKSLALLGVEPILFENDITIFANPVKDFVDIKFTKPFTGELALMTISGKVVSSASVVGSREAKIRVSDLPASTYVLTFTLKNGAVSGRRVIKF